MIAFSSSSTPKKTVELVVHSGKVPKLHKRKKKMGKSPWLASLENKQWYLGKTTGALKTESQCVLFGAKSDPQGFHKTFDSVLISSNLDLEIPSTEGELLKLRRQISPPHLSLKIVLHSSFNARLPAARTPGNSYQDHGRK